MRKVIEGKTYDTTTCRIIERKIDGKVLAELCSSPTEKYFIHIANAEGTAMQAYDIHKKSLTGEWLSPCTLDEGMSFLQDFEARYISNRK